MNNISKAFPGVQALKNVNFNLAKGEIHALMGENGAGKSTLIKILTGIYQKDSGEILLDGKTIAPASSSEAQQLGITSIYQEINLVPNLSVCENIFLGRQQKKKGLIDWAGIENEARRLLMSIGIDIDVRQLVSSLSTPMQQMVAIVRAMSLNAKMKYTCFLTFFAGSRPRAWLSSLSAIAWRRSMRYAITSPYSRMENWSINARSGRSPAWSSCPR